MLKMAGFKTLSPIVTTNEGYRRYRWKKKGSFWMSIQNAIDKCKVMFPDLDPDVTLMTLLDLDWTSYEDARDFLLSYEVKEMAPTLYECMKEEEREKNIELMAEEEDEKALEERREKRCRELLKEWVDAVRERDVDVVEDVVGHLITEYPNEILSVYKQELTMMEGGEEGDYDVDREERYGFPAIEFYDKYSADILTNQHLKRTLTGLKRERKKLENALRRVQKAEKEIGMPTTTTTAYSKEIMDKLDKIEKEIAKLRKEQKKILKRPIPEVPSVSDVFLREKEGEMVVECELYDGTVVCLNRKWSKDYDETGIIDPEWFHYYIGRIAEIRNEGISKVIINSEGRKYYLERDLVRNRWCLRDPTTVVPYVFVNEWTLRELTNIIYGYVQKGYLEYLKQCVYSYVNDPYIEMVMRKANKAGSRLHADVRPIDEVMEDELTEHASEHSPTEIAFIKRFIKKYREEEKKCSRMGGLNVIGK